MREQDVQRFLVEALNTLGWARQITATAEGGKGIPDILSCIDGKFYGIEVKKSPTDRATPEQERNLYQIWTAGGTALVISGMDEAVQFIRKIAKEKNTNGTQQSITDCS